MFSSGFVVAPFVASVRVGLLDISTSQNPAPAAAIALQAANCLDTIKRRLESTLKKLSDAQKSTDADQGEPVLLLHPETAVEIELAQALGATHPLRIVLHQPLDQVLTTFPNAQILNGKEVIAEILTAKLTPNEQALAPKQAREMVLRQCDLLIAIVDDPHTVPSEVHQFVARERRVLPLVAISAASPGNTVLISIEGNRIDRTADINPGLNSWLDRFLLPDKPERLGFKKWEPGFTIGGLYPYLLWFLTGDRPSAESFRINDYPERAKTALAVPHLEWMKPASQDIWKQIGTQYSEAYVWSDRLALYYGNLARTHILVLMFMGLTATCAILFGLKYQGVWHPIEQGALAAVIVTALLIWRRRLKQNWLDYRLLAELIRPMPYLAAIGGQFWPAAHIKGKNERAWNRSVWQYQSLARAARIPTIVIGPEYLSDAKIALTDLVEGQINWHLVNEKKQHKAHARLHTLALFAFGMVVLISASHGIQLGVREISLETFQPYLLIAAGVLTALASMLGGALNYFGFDQIADRSESARAEFERLKTRMDYHPARPTIEQLFSWATELTAIMAEEQLDWHNQMSSISIHLG